MKEPVTTAAAPAPAGAYSQGILIGDFLYTAGFGPQDPNTGRLPEGIEEQTRQVLRNVEAVLRERDLDLSHVVKATVHLHDLDRDFPAFDRTYSEVMPAPHPVRTTVGSTLAGILVEIDVVAHL
jgi:2-iminobutanoate/2-iminopropanoate deaminase